MAAEKRSVNEVAECGEWLPERGVMLNSPNDEYGCRKNNVHEEAEWGQ
jgi:hypothetical protein